MRIVSCRHETQGPHVEEETYFLNTFFKKSIDKN